MDNKKTIEFLAVLTAAVVVAGAAIVAMYRLSGAVQKVVVAVIIFTALFMLQYLRKKFGRS
jgi:hypothetical protein